MKAKAMTSFRYEWGKTEDPVKSKELGRPFYKPAVFCRFAKQGGDIVLPVNKAFEETYLAVRFPHDADHVRHVQILKDAYEDFKKNGSREIAGTPVKEWPLVNAAEVENLRVVGIETVEQLAEVPDESLKEFGVSKALRQKAKEYLAHAADAGVHANKAAELVAENEQLKAENKELKAEVKTLNAQVAALSKADKSKGT